MILLVTNDRLIELREDDRLKMRNGFIFTVSDFVEAIENAISEPEEVRVVSGSISKECKCQKKC